MANKYLAAFPIHDLARIADLLIEKGELFVAVFSLRDIRSGGAERYFIRSLHDIRTLILEYNRELLFEAHRTLPIILRGIADSDFVERALQEIPQGRDFYVFCFAYYPDEAYFVVQGTTHEVLLNAVAELWGESVAIGTRDSLTSAPYNKDVLLVDLRLSWRTEPPSPATYAPYEANPERYQWIVDMWKE